MIKKIVLIFAAMVFCSGNSKGQGYNHQWLVGYWPPPYFSGSMLFDSSSYTYSTSQRKMSFWGTEGNICDKNGNFLMSSNGVWIANANNDTMFNGGGLNPGQTVIDWPNGLPMTNNNMFLPYPDDTNKYALIHHTATFNGTYMPAYEVFLTLIDMTLDSGLGGVILKNDIVLNDTLNFGIAACKHANGRDWWIVVMKDSDIVFKLLLTPGGITTVSFQHLFYLPLPWGNPSQLTFSRNGEMLCTSTYVPNVGSSSAVLFDFDRCTGLFSNSRVIPLTSNSALWGLAFSSSGKYLYACSSQKIFQIDTDSLNVDTVASYDGFFSPDTNCCATTFWNMYLAANGKIYVTSGSGVQHIHKINYPDSAGLACDVQQHAINLGIYNLRAVPNHPNYYLGPVTGSVCDSLTGMDEYLNEIKNFTIKPNPNNGSFSINYLLPQNKPGSFEVFDAIGKMVFKISLPPWSTLQQVNLPKLAPGIYHSVISSGGNRNSKKIAVLEY